MHLGKFMYFIQKVVGVTLITLLYTNTTSDNSLPTKNLRDQIDCCHIHDTVCCIDIILLKVQMKCCFIADNSCKSSKNQEADHCLPFLNISFSSRVTKVFIDE